MEKKKGGQRKALEDYLYYKDIQSCLNLQPGEYHVIDYFAYNSFMTMFANYRAKLPATHVRFKSVRVSKDKVYIFKCDLKVKIVIQSIVKNYDDIYSKPDNYDFDKPSSIFNR